MSKFFFCLLLIIIPTGCASPVSSEKMESLPPVITKNISSKTNFTDLVTHYLAYYIRIKAELDVERVDMEKLRPVELVAVNDKNKEHIYLRVHKLSIFSDDLLLSPLEADLLLELEVLDQNGDEIYRRAVTGHHQNSTVFEVLEESAEHLAEGVVKDALKRLIQDPELKKVIAKHKYGTLGSIAAMF